MHLAMRSMSPAAADGSKRRPLSGPVRLALFFLELRDHDCKCLDLRREVHH
jgi:hypothetical protein